MDELPKIPYFWDYIEFISMTPEEKIKAKENAIKLKEIASRYKGKIILTAEDIIPKSGWSSGLY